MAYIKVKDARMRFYEGDKLVAERLVGDWDDNQPLPEPRNVDYFKNRCGPWIATMQIDMGSGDYYFYVDGNVVSMLKWKCVYDSFKNDTMRLRNSELPIFKKHRKWLMDEYGITCAKFV